MVLKLLRKLFERVLAVKDPKTRLKVLGLYAISAAGSVVASLPIIQRILPSAWAGTWGQFLPDLSFWWFWLGLAVNFLAFLISEKVIDNEPTA